MKNHSSKKQTNLQTIKCQICFIFQQPESTGKFSTVSLCIWNIKLCIYHKFFFLKILKKINLIHNNTKNIVPLVFQYRSMFLILLNFIFHLCYYQIDLICICIKCNVFKRQISSFVKILFLKYAEYHLLYKINCIFNTLFLRKVVFQVFENS